MLQSTNAKKNIALINCILVLFVFFCGLLCHFDSSVTGNKHSVLSRKTCSLQVSASPLSPVLLSKGGADEAHINNLYHSNKKEGEYTKTNIASFIMIAVAALFLQLVSFLCFQINFINKCVKQRLSVIRYIHNSDGPKGISSIQLI